MSSKRVKVVVRTRPTARFAKHVIILGEDRRQINIHMKKRDDSGYVNNQLEDWQFKFDKVLHNASQETIYDECARDIISQGMAGYNGSIMAYGQTGAGKTFTMTGATESYKHRGIIPRAIAQIFKEIASKSDSAITIRVSYLEIYNECIYDLLSTLPGSEDADQLHVVEDSTGNIQVKGLTVKIANNEEEALNLLFEGETNRATARHSLNKHSSRSHCIFTIYIESRSRIESSEKFTVSKLNLIDLAGSERLSKTGSDGNTMVEAMYINKSLTFLEQTVVALADKKREHIPYRQTKLTSVLKDSIGGNCNTLMIANVWGETSQLEETISTFRFGTRMMCVATNPTVNIKFDLGLLVKKYEREIKELKQELAMHDTISNRTGVSYEPYSDSQKYELQKEVRAYLDGEVEEMNIVNLRQIREIMVQFRNIIRNMESACEEKLRQKYLLKEKDIPSTGDSSGDRQAASVLEDESGAVGEIDGDGFGIGNAPSSARPSNTQFPKKDKKRPTQKEPSALGLSQNKDKSTVEALGASTTAQGGTANDQRSFSPQARAQERMNSVPSRADAFEDFKKNRGSEITRILSENKTILREKRKMVKNYAQLINNIKDEIDQKKKEVEEKKDSLIYNGTSRSGVDQTFLEEEEYTLLKEVQDLKTKYRELFEDYKNFQMDKEYCSKLVDQCRQKLMSEFEIWYQELYSQIDSLAASLEKDNCEDLIDEQEAFDMLQMERIKKEDPDSAPFYAARKSTARRLTAAKTDSIKKKSVSKHLPQASVRNKPPGILVVK